MEDVQKSPVSSQYMKNAVLYITTLSLHGYHKVNLDLEKMYHKCNYGIWYF